MDKKVVVRLTDGRLLKGTTGDFHPGADNFTVNVSQGPWKGEAVPIKLQSVKALFFVKELTGNRAYREKKMQAPSERPGKKVTVTFLDGETIRGTATGLNLGLKGFYLFPSDPKSNNKRIFIVHSAVKHIKSQK